jgi:hypothetical protein
MKKTYAAPALASNNVVRETRSDKAIDMKPMPATESGTQFHS